MFCILISLNSHFLLIWHSDDHFDVNFDSLIAISGRFCVFQNIVDFVVTLLLKCHGACPFGFRCTAWSADCICGLLIYILVKALSHFLDVVFSKTFFVGTSKMWDRAFDPCWHPTMLYEDSIINPVEMCVLFCPLRSCCNLMSNKVRVKFCNFEVWISTSCSVQIHRRLGRMSVLTLLLNFSCIGFLIVCGDRPIGDPNLPPGASAAEIEGSVKYNLIETDASCFYNRVCPMFPPGLFPCYLAYLQCPN